ncbi:fungal-specific transcription factor domain-containing protein [Mycena sp. CBHHK59/15]|nr:fungal-specific transcription factor domain-containing protein [Mycena sp. CBHHK59/15]
MSSDEESDSAVQKRRVKRPCDTCRRRKRDGGERCSRCTNNNITYVEGLEMRLQTIESLLRAVNARPVNGSENESTDSASPRSQVTAINMMTRAIRSLNNPFPAPHSDDLIFVDVEESFRSLSLDNPSDQGFQGKSSGAMLVKAALDFKTGQFKSSTTPKKPASGPAPKTWNSKPWEDPSPPPTYTFPDDDLSISLISLYFDNVNVFFPLLHRPTFEKAFAEGMHLCHEGFAGTLLLVCALGSRYSDDPRVHLSHVKYCGTAGWKWFDQVQLTGHPLRRHPTLYDLQCYCLAIQFLDRTSGSRECWTLVGFGIRLSQDIGAHRFKLRQRQATIEEEMEKRAVWILIVFDTQFSGALGRSVAIQDHDFDLELPTKCDDEYWEQGDRHQVAFRQPPTKPSLVEFFKLPYHFEPHPRANVKNARERERFRCFLTLNFRFIKYSTNRTKALIGLSDDRWEEKVVMELDSSLNTWFNSIPEHLRWDAARPDDMFFDQSAALYCNYYLVQILVHRPFIPALRCSNPTNLPSLTICKNAARACCHVADIQQRRRPNSPLVFAQTAVFTAGIVLLLNTWGSSRTGKVGESIDRDLSDVHRCMRVLKAHRERWPSTGPLLNTLQQLLAVYHAPARPANDIQQGHADPSPFVRSDPDGGSSSFHAGPSATGRFEPSIWPVHNPSYESAPKDYMNDYMGDYMASYIGPGKESPRAPIINSNTVDAFAEPTLSATDSGYPNPPYRANWDIEGAQNMHDVNYLDLRSVIDTNTISIWSQAPNGFEVGDWDMYLSNMCDTTQADFGLT